MAFSAQTTFAHAKLLRSHPANGEKLQEAPKAVVLTFSEQLQPTEINSIVVTDSNGRRVDKNVLLFSTGGNRMTAALEDLISGTFTVEWKALSADDHLMKGKFKFTVAEMKMPESAATPQVTATLQTADPPNYENAPTILENQTIAENQTPPAQQTGTLPIQSLVRWLAYLAMMTLFGGFAFLLLVLKTSLRNAPNLQPGEKARAFVLGVKRFIGLTRLSLLLIVISAFAALVLQTSSLLDLPITQAIAPSNLFRVLTQTGFGTPWFMQIGAALAIFVITLFVVQKLNDDPEKAGLSGGKLIFWVGLIISALLLGTLSLTGHARAAQAEYKFAVLSDWLHLIAAGIWVGGIFHLVLTLPKSVSGLPDLLRLTVLSRVISRFSGLAVACTILLALTGIYNSWIHLGSFRDLYNTPYGITLLVKIILFLLMLPLGGFNRFFIRPHVEKLVGAANFDANSRTIKDFQFVLILETAFAAVILLIAAILAFLPHSQEHHAEFKQKNSPIKPVIAVLNNQGTIKNERK